MNRILRRLRNRETQVTVFIVVVALALLCFYTLAEEVAEREKMLWDEAFMGWLHGFAHPWLDRLMLFLSFAASAVFTVPLNVAVILALALRKHWRNALFWLVSTAGAAILNLAGKHYFERARPELWHRLGEVSGFSFPSGHAMQSMAIAMAVIVLSLSGPRWYRPAIAGMVCVLAVGLSRTYLGVHYPSDILAGWFASIAWVLLAALLIRPWLETAQPGTTGIREPG